VFEVVEDAFPAIFARCCVVVMRIKVDAPVLKPDEPVPAKPVL